MKFNDDQDCWISVEPVNTGVGSNIKKLLDELTQECRKSGEIPPASSFDTRPGNGGTHLIVIPR